jgi:hypothetical protein
MAPRLLTCASLVAIFLAVSAARAAANVTEGVPTTLALGTLTLTCPAEGDPDETVYADCDQLASQYTAAVNWGFGTASGTATKQSCPRFGGSCPYSVSATLVLDESPPLGYPVDYSVTYETAYTPGQPVTETDAGAYGSLHVDDAPLHGTAAANLSSSEGSAPSLTLGSITDENPIPTAADYSVTIDWGDGSAADAGTAVPNGAGGFDIRGSHAYAETGTYAVSVRVQDDGGQLAFLNLSIVVTDAPLAATGATGLKATADSPTGVVTLATFADADSLSVPGDFAATVEWGDGRTSSGQVAGAHGAFTVRGQHTYSRAGTFHATVSVVDRGGSRASAPVTITVAPAGAPMCSTDGGALHLAEGAGSGPSSLAAFSDVNPNLDAGDFTATVDWGDGTPATSGTVAAAGPHHANCAAFTVGGAHTYDEEGRFTIRVTVRDPGGASIIATTSALVADQRLSVISSSHPHLKQGQAYSRLVLARFRDADPGAEARDYRASIDWGDGTAHTAGTVSRSGAGFVVRGEHIYNAFGRHFMTVVIADAGGASITARPSARVKPEPTSGRMPAGVHQTGASATITELTVVGAAIGSRVVAVCRGAGCPFHHLRRVARHRHTVDLTPLFRGHQLSSSGRLTVALTRRGWCGKYWNVPLDGSPFAKHPKILAPGATKPGRRCR